MDRFRYPRAYPRLDDDGEPCRYDALSLSAFRRHLMVRHGTTLSVRGRGRAPYESYHRLDPDEVQRRRAYISCSQEGRAEFRRQLLDEQFGAAARRPSGVSAGRGHRVSAGNHLCPARPRCLARRPWRMIVTTRPPRGSRRTCQS